MGIPEPQSVGRAKGKVLTLRILITLKHSYGCRYREPIGAVTYTNMKPLFCNLLAIILSLSAWTSAGAFTVNGLNYSVKDGVATLTGATSKSITSLTVPASVTYNGTTYPVNYIQQNAFDNYTSLRSVRFEESDAHYFSHQMMIMATLTLWVS